MAKVQFFRADVGCEITLNIDETEARALDAMFSYGADAFLAGFEKCLGKTCVEPHKAGIRRLHDTIRKELSPCLATMSEARRQLQEQLRTKRSTP